MLIAEPQYSDHHRINVLIIALYLYIIFHFPFVLFSTSLFYIFLSYLIGIVHINRSIDQVYKEMWKCILNKHRATKYHCTEYDIVTPFFKPTIFKTNSVYRYTRDFSKSYKQPLIVTC